MFAPGDPEILAQEQAELRDLDNRSRGARLRWYFSKSGPGWMQSAMTLGGGLHAESMFALARMYLGDRIIPYADLDFAFIAPETGVVFNDAYAQSLSMTRFLIDRISAVAAVAASRGAAE